MLKVKLMLGITLLVISVVFIIMFYCNRYETSLNNKRFTEIKNTFSIYDCAGNFYETLTVTENGVFASSNLKPGHYIVVDDETGLNYRIEIEANMVKKTYNFSLSAPPLEVDDECSLDTVNFQN